LTREVLQIFLEEKDNALAKVVESWKKGDAVGLRAAAHYFKGMSANVSAAALRDICREIEQKAVAGDLPGAGRLVEQVPDLLGQTADAVREHLKG
jgi:HPt (histidine-containing phosphotransfer) domain-containing protein